MASSPIASRTFVWHFDRPPEAVWPALADTARFNEAAGLPRHAIESVAQPDGSVRAFGRARIGPFALAWEEVPVEWVDGRWFRHRRLFSQGPFAMLDASLELAPEGAGGCVARYTLAVRPRTLAGQLLLALGFLRRAGRTFTALAEGVRAWSHGRRERAYDVPVPAIDSAARARAEAAVVRIAAAGHDQALARRLLDWMVTAPEADVGRIRPLELASVWQSADRAVVELCLQGVAEGLLELRWDLLCPRCRGAKLSTPSLDRLPTEAHCPSCNIAYDRDFDRNVELTFRPAAWLRPVAEGEYCVFGPMTTPHVRVQIRLEPGERRTLPATLAPGPYRLRTFEPGGAVDLDWPEPSAAGRAEGFPEIVAEGSTVRAGPPAPAGTVILDNRTGRPLTLVVESRAWLRHALTAHRATTLQAFRDLFPTAGLMPGDEAPVAQVALLFTDLKGSTALYQRIGDAAAFPLLRRHFAFLAALVREHRGAVVKTIGDAVMAAFAEPADAVRAALAIQEGMAAFNADAMPPGEPPILLRLGVHAGPCVAVTLNDRLDYFGTTANLAARLEGESSGGDIVLSAKLGADPRVAALIARYAAREEVHPIRGFIEPVALLRIGPDSVPPQPATS